MEERRVWGVHTYDDNLFLSKNIIAVGSKNFGDLTKIEGTREAFKAHFIETYPDTKKGSVPSAAGKLFRFLYDVKIGDCVVFPSKTDRMINIGIIESDYYFENSDVKYVHRRKVKWLKHISRTSFSQGALYEIGSIMSFFMVKNYADEYLLALDNGFRHSVDDDSEDESVGTTAEDIKESTKDFILKELSRKLKGYDLEPFIKDLLEAMGYNAKVSQHGGDRGIDIIAYKDEFPPRILVQVKSGDGKVQESTIQSLKGAMREGDYGLFVTLSDYTPNAKKYLESVPIIKGINGAELVELILRYYDKLSDKYKKIIPLEMVYIPVPPEDETHNQF